MSGQLKAGDLAIIIGGNELNEVGRQVELISFYENGQEYLIPESTIRVKNISGRSVWLVKGNVSGSIVKGYTQKAPYNLMPLRGDFTPEEVREMEKDYA